MTMVVGMFDSLVEVQRAVADLIDAGYPRHSISIVVRDAHVDTARVRREFEASPADAHDPRDGTPPSIDVAKKARVLAGGPLAAVLRQSSGEYPEGPLVRTLTLAGLGLASARYFADAIGRGAVMIAVQCEDRRVRDTRDLLDAHGTHSHRYTKSARESRPPA